MRARAAPPPRPVRVARKHAHARPRASAQASARAGTSKHARTRRADVRLAELVGPGAGTRAGFSTMEVANEAEKHDTCARTRART